MSTTAIIVRVFTATALLVTSARAFTVADYSLRDQNNNVLLPGRLSTPPEAADSRRPLLVFLHGGGANGTDNFAQLTHLTDGMREAVESRGAYFYIPQTPDGWGGVTRTGQVLTMIDRAINELNADQDRVYIMGYSNGGGGTWNLLSRYDGRFAAAIALSGVAPGADFVASRLVDTPILALHARDDATVSITTSRNVLDAILNAAHEPLTPYPSRRDLTTTLLVANGHLPVQSTLRSLVPFFGPTTETLLVSPVMDLMYVETGSGGHTGLYDVFNAPPVYDWLFSHTLAVPEPSPAISLLGILFVVVSRRRK
jgi:predicted peptidase